jgi:methylamine dehydrogenase light chain
MSENSFPVDDGTMQAQADWTAGKGGSLTSQLARRMSEVTSRRSVLGLLGRWSIGAAGVAIIGTLPVTRNAAQAGQLAGGSPSGPLRAGAEGEPLTLPYDETGDPASCEYWRWCNMDGTPCTSCAGGGLTTCPPGSRPGAEYWVGCCTNPDDGTSYLIAYYDCCGSSGCSTTFCGEPDTQASMYNPILGSFDPDILWCVSDESQSYTCTMAPVIGTDCQASPAARPKVGAGSR